MRRAHHYLYAHKMLPAYLWQEDSMLGILANPENQDYLVNLWEALPDTDGFMHQVTAHREEYADPEEIAIRKDLGIDVTPPDVYEQILSPDELGYSAYWIGGEHLVFVIRFPEPQGATEAYFAAITTSPMIRYFTLERRENDEGDLGTMFCEWQREGGHLNYGDGSEPREISFLYRLCQFLDIPVIIEPPTDQQQGMSLGAPTLFADHNDILSDEDMHQVEVWVKAAEMAEGFEEKIACYHQVLTLRMDKQGPENTEATLAYNQLIWALNCAERYDEAEALCLEWWRLCRRYRMLGHAETMLVIESLASCYKKQGRFDEAQSMLQYRASLAKLSRGEDSDVARQAEKDLENGTL